jgi:3-mercaptopyruvate sulfurtransferase SseA
MKRENQFVIYDKHGNKINEGDLFTFKYITSKNIKIILTGSFEWNEDELRYEVDIHGNTFYTVLSYVCGMKMSDFEKI